MATLHILVEHYRIKDSIFPATTPREEALAQVAAEEEQRRIYLEQNPPTQTFPVQRVVAQTLRQEQVTVAPMSAPKSIFYIDMKYGNTL